MALSPIYRTPDQYLEDMITSVQASGAQVSDFHFGGVARTFFEAEGVALSNQSLTAEQLRADSHLETATGEALDLHGADYQVARLGGTLATGVVRISRADTSVALTIPAGWSQLHTKALPGLPEITFVTTQDAVFNFGDDHVDVTATAVAPGSIANIGIGTVLLPDEPIVGFQTDGGFVAHVNFTNGVDPETDDVYRFRIKVTVQGRVNGTRAALLAAALSVNGVASANVLRAGDARADASVVAPGSVEVYYAGSSGVLSQVDQAVKAAATYDQNESTYAALLVRLIANLTITTRIGTDTAALTTVVVQALRDTVTAVPVGGLLYHGAMVFAVMGVPNVVSVNVPFTDLRRFTEGGGTSHDIQLAHNEYADLEPADVTVAVNLI